MYSHLTSWCPLGDVSYGGVIMMFFGVILVGLVVYLLVRGNGQLFSSTRQERNGEPLEILKKRFAEGTISEEEFNRIKQELDS